MGRLRQLLCFHRHLPTSDLIFGYDPKATHNEKSVCVYCGKVITLFSGTRDEWLKYIYGKEESIDGN
jgi:hypothetical protein